MEKQDQRKRSVPPSHFLIRLVHITASQRTHGATYNLREKCSATGYKRNHKNQHRTPRDGFECAPNQGDYRQISKISQSTLLVSMLKLVLVSGRMRFGSVMGCFSSLCVTVGTKPYQLPTRGCRRRGSSEHPSLLIADVIGGGSIGQNSNAVAPRRRNAMQAADGNQSLTILSVFIG